MDAAVLSGAFVSGLQHYLLHGHAEARPGVLALTSHGMDLQMEPNDGQGFAYRAAGGAEGLPDFYRTSFHTTDRLRTSWGEHLDIVAVLPKAVNDHHDLVLARKP